MTNLQTGQNISISTIRKIRDTKKQHDSLQIITVRPLPASLTVSLSSNIDVISQYITSNKFNIIALTETWLNVLDTVTPAAIEALNYHFIKNPRSDGHRGGGVSLLTDSTCKITFTKNITMTNYELLLTKLLVNSIYLTIITCYRPLITIIIYLLLLCII